MGLKPNVGRSIRYVAQTKMLNIYHSVSDLHGQLHDVISNPRLMAHTMQSHEVFVQSVHETADTSSRRKRKRTAISEPAHEHPEITTLRNTLDNVQLQSWP